MLFGATASLKKKSSLAYSEIGRLDTGITIKENERKEIAMKEFTAEMLNALTEANNSVKGSTNYSKFYMQTECKNEKGRWFFIGHYIPHNTGKIRTVEKYEADYNELMDLLAKAENERSNMPVRDFGRIESILHDGWKAIYENLDDAYKRAFWRSFIQSIEVEWNDKTKEIKNVNFFD